MLDKGYLHQPVFSNPQWFQYLLSQFKDFTSVRIRIRVAKPVWIRILISHAVPINVDFFTFLLYFMQVISSKHMLPRQKIGMYRIIFCKVGDWIYLFILIHFIADGPRI
jgi:hypothetical protein